ncbi:MAG: PD-(D/E)XK nuclease family protein [Candidatus Acidiferrales bacterium]
MPIYSHSRLSTFEQCPQRYKFQYLDRLTPDFESIEAFLGSRVHDTLEKLYADLKFDKVATLEELLAYYDRQWEMEFNANIRVVRAGRSPDNYRAAGRKMLERYYRRFHPFNQGTTLGLELHLNFPLADGVQFQGYIDRVTRTGDHAYEIHDYKTSNSTPSQAEAERDRQLALYEIGLRQRWPDAREVKLIWHYLLSETDLEVVKKPAGLEAARKETLKVVREVEAARDFPPHESRLCDWCGFYSICPAKQHGQVVKALPKSEARAESGVQLVDRYVALKEKMKAGKAQLEELEEAIYAFAEKSGATVLVGSEKQVRVKVSEEKGLPTQKDNPLGYAAVEDLLRRSGCWDKVSSLDRGAVLEALEEGELPAAVARQLEPFLETRLARRLTVSKRSGQGQSD